MDWQFIITCCTIALAVGYMLWRGRHAWRSLRGGCGGGCGCAKTANVKKPRPELIAPEQLVLRGRFR